MFWLSSKPAINKKETLKIKGGLNYNVKHSLSNNYSNKDCNDIFYCLIFKTIRDKRFLKHKGIYVKCFRIMKHGNGVITETKQKQKYKVELKQNKNFTLS